MKLKHSVEIQKIEKAHAQKIRIFKEECENDILTVTTTMKEEIETLSLNQFKLMNWKIVDIFLRHKKHKPSKY